MHEDDTILIISGVYGRTQSVLALTDLAVRLLRTSTACPVQSIGALLPCLKPDRGLTAGVKCNCEPGLNLHNHSVDEWVSSDI